MAPHVPLFGAFVEVLVRGPLLADRLDRVGIGARMVGDSFPLVVRPRPVLSVNVGAGTKVAGRMAAGRGRRAGPGAGHIPSGCP